MGELLLLGACRPYDGRRTSAELPLSVLRHHDPLTMTADRQVMANFAIIGLRLRA